jgi:N-acetylglucosaminyldiphosphoundecaprenol N-acetyl-beta-D-mannosaminyltransferase
VIYGVPFHDVTFSETVDWCVEVMRQGEPRFIATANVDFLMQARRDPELQRILLEADLVIADGQPVVQASRRQGTPLRERVTGSDLTPLLAAACAREGFRIFLLGGAPGVAERAARALVERNPSLVVAGCYSPPLADLLEMDHEAILDRLRTTRPHLVLVAFGAPKQEKFIHLHARYWPVPLAMGVGGTLDFLAGAQTRAPVWVQRLSLEWLWRMGTNPRRLFKRYAANIQFLAGAWWRWNRARRSAPGLPGTGDTAWTWEQLEEALAKGKPYTLVSLGDRSWLTSDDLGRLVDAARQVRRRGGRLLLYGGTGRLRSLLEEFALVDYLEHHPDRTSAEQRHAELVQSGRAGRIETVDRVLQVSLPMELTIEGLAPWNARIAEAWQPGLTGVCLEAAGLEFIDSAGIGWLVSVAARCRDEGIYYRANGFRGAALRSLRLARVADQLTGNREPRG